MIQNHKSTRRGFTLLEILLVIAVIGILAAIVLVAINPNRQIAQARNTQRRSDVNTLYKALEQYLIDNRDYPAGIDNTPRDICINGNTTNCVNLGEGILVPTYIASIPVDPTGGAYKVRINLENNRISVIAPGTELGQDIAINPPPLSKFIASSCTYSDKKITIPYTAGKVGYNYASQTINSIDITGLTATLAAGVLSSTGTLEYTVTGTPSGEGTANFNLSNIGNMGVSCNNSNIAVNVTRTLATGGDTTTDITVGEDVYRVHTFTTVGTSSLNVIQGGEFEYLVVGGGGGGAGTARNWRSGGGGGAGGFRSGTLSLITKSYTVTVGGGGLRGANGSSSECASPGQNGSSSVFDIITSSGGGGGGFCVNGQNGGSGGGGGDHGGPIGGLGNTPFVSQSQGNNGGNASGYGGLPVGGGGGALSSGGEGVIVEGVYISGNGGSGIESFITGSSIIYAGGGGGGAWQGVAGSGGLGGGGAGGLYPANGSNGVSNTGGGGGGAGRPYQGIYPIAGNGGSGIVIVRYKLLTY